MARFEGLAGEPDYISGGPRERFSSPQRPVFRVVALGLIAVAVGAFGGYRLGLAHGQHAVRTGHGGEDLAIQGHPSGAGFGAGSVWVTVWSAKAGHGKPGSHHRGFVARYDPVSRQMVAKIPVGSQPLAAQPGFGSMWVSNGFDGTVTRIDLRNNRVLKIIKVGPRPYQIAPAGGGVWVATQNAAVKIDPVTNKVVARAAYPHPEHTETPTTAGVSLDANAHGVWVSTAYGTVLRLRPSDGRLLKVIDVQPVRNSQPGMIAIDGNNVWVSSYTIESTSGPGAANENYGPVNHLTDISTRTDKVINRVPTAGYPVDSFLPQHGKILIVGNDYQHNTSALIRTDWPYQVVTSIRRLDGSSFDVVDTHGSLWIPSFTSRAVQIIPDPDGPPNNLSHDG